MRTSPLGRTTGGNWASTQVPGQTRRHFNDLWEEKAAGCGWLASAWNNSPACRGKRRGLSQLWTWERHESRPGCLVFFLSTFYKNKYLWLSVCRGANPSDRLWKQLSMGPSLQTSVVATCLTVVKPMSASLSPLYHMCYVCKTLYVESGNGF